MGQQNSKDMTDDDNDNVESGDNLIVKNELSSQESVNDFERNNESKSETDNLIIKDKLKTSVISTDAKNRLLSAMLKVENENKVHDKLKRYNCNLTCQTFTDTLKQNLEELELENTMLRESVEKYKKLYYDLASSIQSDEIKGS